MDHKFSNMKHSSFNLMCIAILSQSSAHDLWTGNYTWLQDTNNCHINGFYYYYYYYSFPYCDTYWYHLVINFIAVGLSVITSKLTITVETWPIPSDFSTTNSLFLILNKKKSQYSTFILQSYVNVQHTDV